MHDYEELTNQLLNYGTEYAIGNNLGREIDGTADLLLKAKDTIDILTAQLSASEATRSDLAKQLAAKIQQCDQINQGVVAMTKKLNATLEKLEFARGELDAVTRRMIELEQVLGAEARVVYCHECEHHNRCNAERIYLSEGIERPFCCRGKAGGQDG